MKHRAWSVLVLLAPLALAGCMGYSSWPPVEGNTATNNVNIPPTTDVMAVALRHVVNRYPAVPDPQPGQTYENPVAINLPPGITPGNYREVAELVGPNVRPMVEGEDFPTYHIARVHVRGTSATVDVLRPVVGVGGQALPSGTYQLITLQLSTGAYPWKVLTSRAMPIGMAQPPEDNRLSPALAYPGR